MKVNNIHQIIALMALVASSVSMVGARDDGERVKTCDPKSVSQSFEDECETFCENFFRLCVNPGFYQPGKKGWKRCNSECVKYPRPDHSIRRTDVALVGDTFFCRERHLMLAEWEPADAAYHCYAAAPDGAGICTDALVDGKTPYATMRDGKCTHHRFAYCDLSAEDTVADCTNAGIDDDSFADALKLLPPSVKIIFMTNNPGIATSLTNADIFKDNLQSPETVKALYLDNCNIEAIHEDVLDPLYNLEIFSINLNFITTLPEMLFAGDNENGPLEKLKTFSIYGSPGIFPDPVGGKKIGRLTSTIGNLLPSGLLSYTPALENLIMFGHAGYKEEGTDVPGIIYLPDGFLDKLFYLRLLHLGYNTVMNRGIPDGLFNDLESLKYFDLPGNMFEDVEKAWLGKWAANVIRVALQYNMIDALTNENTFECMFELLHVYLHRNPLTGVPLDLFDQNKKLLTFTL